MKLLSGIENTLAARSTARLLQVVPDHDGPSVLGYAPVAAAG